MLSVIGCGESDIGAAGDAGRDASLGDASAPGSGGDAAQPPADAAPALPPFPYEPGESYFGVGDYVEYIAGDLPLIFSAPHGGHLEPDEIPDRTSDNCDTSSVVTVRDSNTQELARAIRTAFRDHTGGTPHVIINRLHRRKLDANRPIGSAACSDPIAEEAFQDFHEFIDIAKERVTAVYGRGWYTDLHGHGHDIARHELGYLLSGASLREPDATLDADHVTSSSIRSFAEESPFGLSRLLRGPASVGRPICWPKKGS